MQIYPSSADDFAAAPAIDNPGFSNSENTDFFFADVDHSGAADKVYLECGGLRRLGARLSVWAVAVRGASRKVRR